MPNRSPIDPPDRSVEDELARLDRLEAKVRRYAAEPGTSRHAKRVYRQVVRLRSRLATAADKLERLRALGPSPHLDPRVGQIRERLTHPAPERP